MGAHVCVFICVRVFIVRVFICGAVCVCVCVCAVRACVRDLNVWNGARMDARLFELVLPLGMLCAE